MDRLNISGPGQACPHFFQIPAQPILRTVPLNLALLCDPPDRDNRRKPTQARSSGALPVGCWKQCIQFTALIAMRFSGPALPPRIPICGDRLSANEGGSFPSVDAGAAARSSD